MPLSTLQSDPHNVNKHTQKGHRLVEQSIRQRGIARPGFAARNGAGDLVILGGNLSSLEVPTGIGLDEAVLVYTDGKRPIIHVRQDLDSDSDEARLLALEDNVAGVASYDPNIAELAELTEIEGFNLIISDREYRKLLAGAVLEGSDEGEDGAAPQIERAAELAAEWKTDLGQVWQCGKHRLMCGDATSGIAVAKLMAKAMADAVITDPPYGQNQKGVTGDEPENLSDLISGAVAHLRIKNAVVVAFASPRTFPMWLDVTRKHGHKFERMLWLYKAAQETFPWRGWLMKSEAILISSVGKGHWLEVNPYAHDCYYKSEVSGELAANSGWHGSIKPLDVVMDLIKRVSPEAGIVYEPFCGSGTTLIGCEKTGRVCYAMEIDPQCVAIALQRYKDTTGTEPVLLGG